jgi:hypothetical protein
MTCRKVVPLVREYEFRVEGLTWKQVLEDGQRNQASLNTESAFCSQLHTCLDHRGHGDLTTDPLNKT